MKNDWIRIFIVLLLFLGIPAVTGTTLNVEKVVNCTSFQAAIHAADARDIIILGHGLYNECITINKAVAPNAATAGISKKEIPMSANCTNNDIIHSFLASTDPIDESVVEIACVYCGNATGSHNLTDISSESKGASQHTGGGMKAPPEEIKISESPVILPSVFEVAILPVPDEQSLSGIIDRFADFILSHIVTVAVLLVLTVACTEAFIWYRQGRY